MCPSEIVVLAVKDLFCRAPLVVVQYDFLVGHVPVVGQYAAVCILAVEEVKLLALLLTLPLYDETAVLHVLETLEGVKATEINRSTEGLLRTERWAVVVSFKNPQIQE